MNIDYLLLVKKRYKLCLTERGSVMKRYIFLCVLSVFLMVGCDNKPTANTELSNTPEETVYYNHLKDETSPYLKQHADNPVAWYPYGDEAFEKALAEDKLIFLSIGYSTCHWCHVMNRESFETIFLTGGFIVVITFFRQVVISSKNQIIIRG